MRDEPLQVFGYEFNSSPVWALGDDIVASPFYEQENALLDAYNNLSLALGEQDKASRDREWGMFFQSLGMVIHHVHDMAQPQHVRQNLHCDRLYCIPFFHYSPSYYEEYTDSHIPRIISDYDCNSYASLDLKDFSRARDFWDTDGGEGIGLAEFTNRNFVSSDTNFRKKFTNIFVAEVAADRRYRGPDPQNGGEGLKITPVNITDPELAPFLPADFQLPGELWFYETMVTDAYRETKSSPNERSSSGSIWADKLDRYNDTPFFPGGTERLFNLNLFNFEARYPFVLPRAIAYSAGLINFVFRGRMGVSDVAYLVDEKVRLKVTNTTADENSGGAPFAFSGTVDQPGRFYLYQDEADDTRWELPSVDKNAAELSSNELFQHEDEMVLEFEIPDGPQFDFSKPLTLVFDGVVGQERGIAIKSFYLPRLLSFDVSRTCCGESVPNVVDIYESMDTGLTWQHVIEFGVALNDNTQSQFDRLAVNAAVYIGNDALLVYPDYNDYDDSDWGYYEPRLFGVRVDLSEKSFDDIPVPDPDTLLAGNGNNFSDRAASLRSITYTGGTTLTALRLQHPASGDPTPRSRSFQLLRMDDWAQSNPWTPLGSWGKGGLPGLSYLGGDSYVMAVFMEASERGDSSAINFDSDIRRTDDSGASYQDLTRFADECTSEDYTCIQQVVPLDDGRLLGWVTQAGMDYPSGVTFYLSTTEGVSWSVYGAAPITPSCSGDSLWYSNVDSVVYLGSSRVAGQPAMDTLFLETTCYQIVEYNGSYAEHETLGENYFVTMDSGVTWTEVGAPPNTRGKVIYAGDNGVVPGLYEMPLD